MSLLALLWLCLCLSASALEVAILTPLNRETGVRQERLDDATRWLTGWLQAQGAECSVIGIDDLGPLTVADVVVVMQIEHGSASYWRALARYLSAGGTVLWNGTTSRQAPPTEADREMLRQLAGIELGAYQADPNLGEGRIDRFMWIEPTAGYPAAKKLSRYAAFAGEALGFEPVRRSEVVAAWRQRDKSTSDGPAIVLHALSPVGRSIFSGTYLVSMAASDNTDALPTKHARRMLAELLGLTLSEERSQLDDRPLNWAPLEGDRELPRAMWIWRTQLATAPTDRADLLRFCRLRDIDTLYIYTGGAWLREPEKASAIAEFVAAASEQGIDCHALDGWAEAVLPENQARFIATVQTVLDYNRGVAPAARFRGYQSDVEPGGLPGYRSDAETRMTLDRHYLDLHQACADLIAASGQDMVFGCATAEARNNHDVDWQGSSKPLLTHLLGFTDYLAIMSYHDEAERVLRASTSIVQAATAAGKEAWVGFETLDVAARHGGPRAITYYEEGALAMEAAIAEVAAALASEVGFGGVAIHCYRSYRTLPQQVDWDYGVADYADLIALPHGVGVDAPAVPLDAAGQVLHGAAAWRGPDDLSAEFRLSWDADALYLRADVVDDRVLADFRGSEIWKGDHLEIWLAADADGPVWQLGVSATGEAWIWYPQALSDTERAAALAAITVRVERPLATGYSVQVRIPRDAVGLPLLAPERSLRIACEVGDMDDPAVAHETLLSVVPERVRNRAASFRVLKLQGL